MTQPACKRSTPLRPRWQRWSSRIETACSTKLAGSVTKQVRLKCSVLEPRRRLEACRCVSKTPSRLTKRPARRSSDSARSSVFCALAPGKALSLRDLATEAYSRTALRDTDGGPLVRDAGLGAALE